MNCPRMYCFHSTRHQCTTDVLRSIFLLQFNNSYYHFPTFSILACRTKVQRWASSALKDSYLQHLTRLAANAMWGRVQNMIGSSTYLVDHWSALHHNVPGSQSPATYVRLEEIATCSSPERAGTRDDFQMGEHSTTANHPTRYRREQRDGWSGRMTSSSGWF